MERNRTPQPGQVYRSPSGLPALYVRTEKRPGRGEPEHLFVETRDRVLFDRWTDEVPEDYALTLDPDAHERAERLADELAQAGREKAALVVALKRAIAVVPVPVANDLRRVYREALA